MKQTNSGRREMEEKEEASLAQCAVPENEWKRPTVNMAIWKEWRKKGTRLRRGKSVKLQKAKGWRRVMQEDVHRCSNVEGGV